MFDNFSGNFDLFDIAIPKSKGKRGRPPHEWCQENSNKINLLFATGHGPEDCAAALDISMPTFRKHYFFEMEAYDKALIKLKAKLLNNLSVEADGGNVAAGKELFRQIDRGQMVNIAPRKKTKKKKLGKKDQANVDAIQAPHGSEWDDLMGEAPKTLVQ